MAIKKKLPNTGREESASPSVDEDESNEAPTAKPGAKVKVKAKAEAVANEELVGLFEQYDEGVKLAESYFVALVEFIQENQIDKATVISSMMQARGIDYESAVTQYSRIRKIFNNEEVLQELKEGKITLKVAREKTKTTQKNPAAAKPEAKEQRFNSTLKAFTAAAKESGFARKEIMVTVEAELKSAGIR